MFDENILISVYKIIPKKNIPAIILHGSCTQKDLITNGSDVDLIIVSDKLRSEKIIEIVNNKKLHIDILDIKAIKEKILEFENTVCSAIFDTNCLGGRILSGHILFDDCSLSDFIKHAEKQLNNQKLILKFYLQSINFIKDYQYQTEMYSAKVLFEKAIDSLGLAILLKNKVYNLNTKHQIKLLKNYLAKEVFQEFINLRFNFEVIENKNEAFQKYKEVIYTSKILEGI